MFKALRWGLLLLCGQVFALPSIAIFYGKNVPIMSLCTYDIVVVDPYSDYKPTDCAPNTTPIAYVSLGEVGKGAPYEKEIKPEWVIGKNPAWNNNSVMDQTNKEWQAFFLDKLVEPLWQQGYRGFFLDTMDSYFLSTDTYEGEQKQIAGMVTIIKELKKRHPEAKLIFNRGFQILPYTSKDVYAVAIESLYHGWNNAKQRYEKTSIRDQEMLFKEIAKIRQMDIPIIIIDYLPPAAKAKAKMLSDELSKEGFIPWITGSSLQQMYIQSFKSDPRDILVLYTNQEKREMLYVPVLRYLGTILEYMGYVVTYQDISANKVLPKEDLKDKYVGIVLWLDTHDPKPRVLMDWVQKQIHQKIPVVFMSSFGISPDSTLLNQLNLYTDNFKESKKSLTVAQLDTNYVSFETPPPKMPYYFFPVHARDSKVLLQVENEHHQKEDAVAITSWGGYALTPYIILELPDYFTMWVINPFTFFTEALRLKPMPVPDATTENGRRLLLIHIDGDGFVNKARWPGGRYAAEELRDRILKKYRLPTSFSVITGEIAPNGAYPKISKKMMAVARDIYKLPWIEIASHSFSHPFNWQPVKHAHEDFKSDQIYGLTIPGYKMDLYTEIVGSVEFINKHLAPPGKKAALMLWTGLANPNPYALSLVEKNGLYAMNGLTDTRLSNEKRSIAGIRPMAAKMGNYYQVFAPFPMDFQYINEFKGPMYGFEQMIQTAYWTDKPRRFKPIDIYYHIYAASYPATLKALITLYEWALKQDVMFVYATDYIKKVLDMYHIRMGRWGESWKIFSNGDLRELRSVKELGYPNFMTSQNVVGYSENDNDYYIHLGPNRMTVLDYQKDKPTVPYLMFANARVMAFARKNEKQLTIKLQGHTPVEFTLGNVDQCRVTSLSPLKLKQTQDQQRSYTSSEKRLEILINC